MWLIFRKPIGIFKITPHRLILYIPRIISVLAILQNYFNFNFIFNNLNVRLLIDYKYFYVNTNKQIKQNKIYHRFCKIKLFFIYSDKMKTRALLLIFNTQIRFKEKSPCIQIYLHTVLNALKVCHPF